MANTALLNNIINMVYTETNRPDLVPDTLQAVLEATLTAHTLDFLPRDITEAQVFFDTPTNYIQILDSAVIPHFRALAYMRKDATVYNNIEQNPGLVPPSIFPPINGAIYPYGVNLARTPIEFIEPDEFMDPYWKVERTDVCYMAGTNINIKSSTPLQLVRIGWYQFPLTDVTLYNSWIATLYPYVVVYKASSTIFSNIGDQDSLDLMMNPNSGKLTNRNGTGVYDTFLRMNISGKGR